MPDLFDARGSDHVPLADRLRPATLGDVIGQDHLTGPGGPLGTMVAAKRLSSVILWGPPGTGKTTIAGLLATSVGAGLLQISAVTSGVADLRKAFDAADEALRRDGVRPVLLVDEIHRFNKSQQDALLPHVERGAFTLVGATTENPSFEVNTALLSRCQVLTLRRLGDEDLATLVDRAEKSDGPLNVTDDARAALVANAGGDGRYLLGQVEILQSRTGDPDAAPLDYQGVERLLSRRMAGHDKAADAHYNLASAFQKSVRGSDPSAALYYAARMLDAGEDPRFLVRRLMVMASEEVGMADPTALATVAAADHAFRMIGPPEGEYALAQAIVHVSTAPKSNAAYKAWGEARGLAARTRHVDPPRRILNAPTRMMRDQGFKQGYEYDHDAENAFSGQDFWPDEIGPQDLYRPNPRGRESEIGRRLEHWDAIRRERRNGT